MDGLRAALFTILNGDAALTNLLATTTSIYHRRASLNAGFPYVIYTKQAGTQVWAFSGNAIDNQVWMVKGVDKSSSASKTEDIDKRIAVLLKDPVLALSDGNLLYMRREADIDYDEGSDPDYIVHHVGGSYRTFINRT